MAIATSKYSDPECRNGAEPCRLAVSTAGFGDVEGLGSARTPPALLSNTGGVTNPKETTWRPPPRPRFSAIGLADDEQLPYEPRDPPSHECQRAEDVLTFQADG
jgi:hypothetical protein